MTHSRTTRFRAKRQAYSYEMVLLPELWEWFKTKHASMNPVWLSLWLDKSNLSKVPKANGVYTLDVCPRVASHSNHGYVFYVGSGNLHDRFSKYLAKRPSNEDLKSVLEQYDGYVNFSFFEVTDATHEAQEEALYTAMHPPCNRRGLGVTALLARTPEIAF